MDSSHYGQGHRESYNLSNNYVYETTTQSSILQVKMFVFRVSDLYIVKISDFGLTRDIYDSRVYECNDVAEKRLPWKWLAPECIRQGTFTHKSDVVSLLYVSSIPY